MTGTKATVTLIGDDATYTYTAVTKSSASRELSGQIASGGGLLEMIDKDGNVVFVATRAIKTSVDIIEK